MNVVKLLSCALMLLFISCNKEDDLPQNTVPDRITITENNLFPEGIAYDADTQFFYVSSIAQGKISKVALDGTIETFADSPDLVSSIGMKIDALNNRLLVCISDPGFNSSRSDASTVAQLAALAIYDLTTGNRIDFIQLTSGTPHFANDLALDNAGNIYVSDSFAPVIYKIDTNGTVSTLISNPAFSTQPGNFGLNGITVHPDGFLIVSKYDEGKLFKIPLTAPENFSEITITDAATLNIDGIELTDNNTLVIASNTLELDSDQNTIYQLTSSDDWGSVTITNTMETGPNTFPTTFTKVGDELYVQYARLQALISGDNPNVSDFPIVKVVF